MATVIPFPRPRRLAVPRAPSLREILISKGIEPTGDERRRKQRERRQQWDEIAPTTSNSSGPVGVLTK